MEIIRVACAVNSKPRFHVKVSKRWLILEPLGVTVAQEHRFRLPQSPCLRVKAVL